MSTIEIALATEDDLDGILALQAENQPERGGTLSAALPRERIVLMMREMPLLVARRGGHVVGYLMTSTIRRNRDVPVIAGMLKSYRGGQGAYVYGPIAVAAEERGRGVAAALVADLARRLPGREGILFIRTDNAASIRAHEKLGMRHVGKFRHGGAEMLVLSFRPEG